MESMVNVRRKLFFYKRRQMLLLEDGTVYILKNGHINNEMRLSSKTQINHQCDNGGSCRFLISTNSTYEYIDCDNNDVTDTWVSILRKIRKMVIDNETAMKNSRKSKSKKARPTMPGSSRGQEKVIEAKMNPNL
jgi:hypothetical protein